MQCGLSIQHSFTPALRKVIIWEYFTKNENFTISQLKYEEIFSMLSTFPRPRSPEKGPAWQTQDGCKTQGRTPPATARGGPGRDRLLAHVHAEAGHWGPQGGTAPVRHVPTPSPPTTSSHCDFLISAVTSIIQTWTSKRTVTSGASLLCGPRDCLVASSASSLTSIPYVSPAALSLQRSYSSGPGNAGRQTLSF